MFKTTYYYYYYDFGATLHWAPLLEAAFLDGFFVCSPSLWFASLPFSSGHYGHKLLNTLCLNLILADMVLEMPS